VVSDKMRLAFLVPGSPVPCARPRVVRQPGRGVRTIMPKATVDYESRVALVALSCRPEDWPLDAQRYSVDLFICRGEKRGDCDNFLKGVLDGLTGVLWKNDARVTKASVELVEAGTKRVPHTFVVVEVLEQ
jgi:Holliday junction resolvase RusA-like endonuclease